jgi:hypothetical protein
MNKADQKQINKAVALVGCYPSYFAATVACIYRSGNAKTQAEIDQIIKQTNTQSLFKSINGTIIAL